MLLMGLRCHLRPVLHFISNSLPACILAMCVRVRSGSEEKFRRLWSVLVVQHLPLCGTEEIKGQSAADYRQNRPTSSSGVVTASVATLDEDYI
jgi:hypothetical protein